VGLDSKISKSEVEELPKIDYGEIVWAGSPIQKELKNKEEKLAELMKKRVATLAKRLELSDEDLYSFVQRWGNANFNAFSKNGTSGGEKLISESSRWKAVLVPLAARYVHEIEDITGTKIPDKTRTKDGVGERKLNIFEKMQLADQRVKGIYAKVGQDPGNIHMTPEGAKGELSPFGVTVVGMLVQSQKTVG